MSDNIGFCPNILHFDSCLCNFVLAGWAFGPVFIVVLNINCLTKNDLSGILDTTDTNFLDPWQVYPLTLIHGNPFVNSYGGVVEVGPRYPLRRNCQLQ